MLGVDDSWDDGKKAAAIAAQELVVKLNFRHNGGLSYGDEDDDDGAVANEVNMALYSKHKIWPIPINHYLRLLSINQWFYHIFIFI